MKKDSVRPLEKPIWRLKEGHEVVDDMCTIANVLDRKCKDCPEDLQTMCLYVDSYSLEYARENILSHVEEIPESHSMKLHKPRCTSLVVRSN